MFSNKKVLTILSLTTIVALILTGCATPTPAVVKETSVVVQTQVVKETQVVESVITATPEPFKPTGTLTIGRAESNTLVLADSRASRHHARLVARDGLLILTDLDSTNGTRVNGEVVRELPVGAGDEIRIGDSVIKVEAIDDGVPDGPDAVGDGPNAGPGAGQPPPVWG